MSDKLAIFHPPGRLGLKGNPFGKDVANLELYRALALHGDFEALSVLSVRASTDAELVEDLLEGRPCEAALKASSILNPRLIADAGSLLRGQPDLYELAWMRRRTAGDRGYSLIGLSHTLAPPAVRHFMAMASVAPTHPWDAIVCTSPSVQAALTEMLDEWGDHLAERTGGRAPPRPQLPVVPLGVDAGRFAALADRPGARAGQRTAMGLNEDETLILWVGRLSYYEKAFPQPMFKAVQAAAEQTGAKVRFVMAGWFPGQRDREFYEAAASAWAPDVAIEFADGNDRDLVGRLWAAADVFLSLVDNIQETFGITPLEAMAAGVPVVASDWDGYRYTVRDGVEGFLIPTLLPPHGGPGDTMVLRHNLEIDSYQAYVGGVAQHTAVNIGRAAQALSALIASPELRRKMGQAGRARVREMFDWPVVARQYRDLTRELAAIRAAAPDRPARHRANPVKGDPFRAFRGFATETLGLDRALTAAPGGAEALAIGASLHLDTVFDSWRATAAECGKALAMIAERPCTVREVLMAFPTERRRAVELGLVWLAKHGFVDWLT